MRIRYMGPTNLDVEGESKGKRLSFTLIPHCLYDLSPEQAELVQLKTKASDIILVPEPVKQAVPRAVEPKPKAEPKVEPKPEPTPEPEHRDGTDKRSRR